METYEEELCRNPIISRFLEDPENKRLYTQAVNEPTSKNKQILDEAFKHFFVRVKVIHYISRLIAGYSVDFDKRIRKNEQQLLSLDALFHNGQTTLLDMLAAGDVIKDAELVQEEDGHYEELFENEVLQQAFQELKPLQREVLVYSFFYGYRNKDIAKRLAISEQRVSYNKKRGLELLKQKVAGQTKKQGGMP